MINLSTSPRDFELVILNATVVTMNANFDVLERAAVAVRDGRVAKVCAVGDLPAGWTAQQTIDATDAVVIPGLINAHTHVPHSLLRGVGDGLPLERWLTEAIFPIEKACVDEDFVKVGARLSIIEMLLGGITTFADMFYYEWEIAREADTLGIRAVLGETVLDFPTPDAPSGTAESLKLAEKFIDEWKGHPRITPAVAPHAPYTCGPETLRAARDLALRTGTPVLIHLSETEHEVDEVLKRYGATPIHYVAREGLFEARVLAAHVVHPQSGELTLLKEHNAGIAHCPRSNMNLASGAAPIRRMLDKELRLGLGTDGAASAPTTNLFEEMGTAARLAKLHHKRADAVAAREVFAMATIGGARALGMEDRIGSIEPGKLADLVVVDTGSATLERAPIYDVYAHLVYATAEARETIVGGVPVVRDKRVLTIDWQRLRRQVRDQSDRITNVMG
ncbi:MAG TPA: amidohydrolase [Blastocatellia bacterium]|nr:amidohydrolase [Blastocatellia bacterium]